MQRVTVRTECQPALYQHWHIGLLRGEKAANQGITHCKEAYVAEPAAHGKATSREKT